MLIKLAIIVAVFVLGGMIFSTEITELFPNTSVLLSDSLKNDISSLNTKITNSFENRLDTSIDKTIQSVSDSVYEGITETGDKLVENVNEKIYQFIHNNKLQKIYLRSLEDNVQDDTTWFYLNKQAAFVEQIAICEEYNQSSLGPIKVTLTSSNIDAIIDWIVFD